MGNYQTIFTENCPQIEAKKMLVGEDFSACLQTCLVHGSYFYIYTYCAIFRDDVCKQQANVYTCGRNDCFKGLNR